MSAGELDSSSLGIKIRMGISEAMTMARVLVVEDQKRLASSLRRGLNEEGYTVETAATGEDGYYLASTQSFDAVVLDLNLPRRDGLQVLKDLRGLGIATPVLILTARDAVNARVAGLDAGADDYLVKPFAFAELLARLRALLRRSVGGREALLRGDNLEVDLLARRVVRDGVEVELSKREFELLEYLLRHKNHTVSREMLARDVWKEPEGLWTNVIEVCVNSLRKKIEHSGQRQLVHTVRGVGYVLRDQ
jgi:two-component system copper resistance phosphate regulon response regulator CusR